MVSFFVFLLGRVGGGWKGTGLIDVAHLKVFLCVIKGGEKGKGRGVKCVLSSFNDR